ncbi:hypothetical protein HGA88_02490 [Candidatus Roizmanbacteria bacterium]|nr:hypothetical protein [Candidatus Roizmanbacteria bacterium]
MSRYFHIFSQHLQTVMQYRANMMVTILVEFVIISSTLFLWFSIFQTTKTVGGMNLSQTVSYYLFIPLIFILTSSTISDIIGDQIKTGDLSNYLMRPVPLWILYVTFVLADKLVYTSLVFPLYFLIVLALLVYGVSISISLVGIVACIGIIVLTIPLAIVLDMSIGWLAFWIDDVWAFTHIKSIVFGLLGGLTFPFEFVPEKVRIIFEALPFKFFFYTPIHYLFSPSFSWMEYINDIGQLILWLSFLFIFCLFLWRKGIQKYGAFGH